MSGSDYVIQLTLSVVLIVGAHQFYFWCQRNALTEARELRLPVDDLIPYYPSWVWIYTVLYYPVILYTNVVIASPREFTHLAMSYLVLLACQMACFLVFPVETPKHWRPVQSPRSRSERFLLYVQKLAARSNRFPSMHVSVATLTALHLLPTIGPWAWVFPLLIGLSCVFTKQHYVIDVPAGVGLGALVRRVYTLGA